MAVNSECIGFWSKSIAGGDIRYRVPLSNVKAVKPHDRGRARDHTLVLEIPGPARSASRVFHREKRDEAINQVNRFISSSRELYTTPTVSSPISLSPAPSRMATIDESLAQQHTQTLDQIPDTILPSGSRNPTSILAPLSRVPSTVQKQNFPYALKSVFPRRSTYPKTSCFYAVDALCLPYYWV